MSSEEALRKVLIQLQTQHVEASRQLTTVRQQLNGRTRELKVNTLTLREIERLPRGADAPACYKSVGRMFMQESRNNVENTLKGKDKELSEEVAVLGKKAKYLESQMDIAQGSLRDLVQEQQR